MKKLAFLILFAIIAFSSFLSLPVQAESNAQNAHNVIDRGPLSKITFIHYRHANAKAGGSTKGTTGSCFTYSAGGAKWRAPKDYIINPTNSKLDSLFVQQAINNGAAEWEKYGSPDIFGVSSVNSSFPVIGFNNDHQNVVSFAPWNDNSVIAVTTIWGYFGGRAATREITEWDILFNNYYTWGDSSVNGSSVMDLQNIATHELGHAAGMGDLYSGSCFQETMYGYSSYGEMEDRTLNSGDIQGISKLY